jgi:Haem-binding domain
MQISLRRTAIGVAATLALAQFIPVERSNPPRDPVGTIWAVTSTPPQVIATFQRSCQDCHANLTKWPWYSHVAPVSWVVVSDVNSGRRHLKMDEWGSYSLEKMQSRLTKMCEELKSGDMPDSKDTFIHRSAKLSDQERTAPCDWAESTRLALVHVESGAHP